MSEEQHNDKAQQKRGINFSALCLGLFYVGLGVWFFLRNTVYEFPFWIIPSVGAVYALSVFFAFLSKVMNAPAAGQDQDHLKQLNHDIEKAGKSLYRWVKYLFLLLIIAAGIQVASAVHKRQHKERIEKFGSWTQADPFYSTPDWIVALEWYIVIVGIFILMMAGWDSINLMMTYKERKVASTCSAVEYHRIKNAYGSVHEFLIEPKERQRLSPRLLQRLIQRYRELEQLDSDFIEEQLEKADVWNTNVKWCGKGRTLDEALMLAIYTGRQPKEDIKKEATEKAFARIEAQNIAAADLQSRKLLEQQKEAAALELDRYTKATATMTREFLPLSIFNGEYAITHAEQKAVAVTLRLDDPGEFEIYRRDGKSRNRLMSVAGGQQVSIALSPPAESGRLEIVKKEDGEFDTISLP
jgi:hypothetical protein